MDIAYRDYLVIVVGIGIVWSFALVLYYSLKLRLKKSYCGPNIDSIAN
jgi:hypothetical protein